MARTATESSQRTGRHTTGIMKHSALGHTVSQGHGPWAVTKQEAQDPILSSYSHDMAKSMSQQTATSQQTQDSGYGSLAGEPSKTMDQLTEPTWAAQLDQPTSQYDIFGNQLDTSIVTQYDVSGAYNQIYSTTHLSSHDYDPATWSWTISDPTHSSVPYATDSAEHEGYAEQQAVYGEPQAAYSDTQPGYSDPQVGYTQSGTQPGYSDPQAGYARSQSGCLGLQAPETGMEMAELEPQKGSTPVPVAKEKFHCDRPGCSKSFSRVADLQRHRDHVHRVAEASAGAHFCDYTNCPRQVNAFYRKDHYRDHLREYHKEDLLKRNGHEPDAWFANRNINPDLWRCGRCLRQNKVSKRGWTCHRCKTACEQLRIQRRTGALSSRSEGRHKSPSATMAM